jgi:glucose 1-dehydrogenase
MVTQTPETVSSANLRNETLPAPRCTEATSLKLKGKTALVTGSSQGIGEAVAIRLAEEGANVVVNYHSHAESAMHVVEAIKRLGRQCIALGANLAQIEDVRRLIEEGVRQFGRLDILVNNAGVELNADFWKVTESDYDHVLGVNLKGRVFHHASLRAASHRN